MTENEKNKTETLKDKIIKATKNEITKMKNQMKQQVITKT